MDRLGQARPSARRPAGELLDESAGFAFPADLHLVAPDQDRHRGRERRRLFPPGGVVVDDALLELHPCRGEVTPRPLTGGSVAQSVEDDHTHVGVNLSAFDKPRVVILTPVGGGPPSSPAAEAKTRSMGAV